MAAVAPTSRRDDDDDNNNAMLHQLPTENPGTTLASSVDAEMVRFRGLQDVIQGMRADIQTLMSQSTENEMVLKELELLRRSSSSSGEKEAETTASSPCAVYKLIGPALIPQDLDEALETVQKRLEFIVAEQKKASQRLEQREQEAHGVAQKIQEMQAMLQQTTAQAVQAVAAQHYTAATAANAQPSS